MSPLAINSATLKGGYVSLVLSNNGWGWSLAMPEGLPAAPLRAERTLRQNTLSSKLKMGPTAGTGGMGVAWIGRSLPQLPEGGCVAISAPSKAWRPADNSPTWINFSFSGVWSPPQHLQNT